MLDVNRDITRVYNGKLGACMCGCSGKYTTNPRFKDLVSKERGYPVSDDECSDRSVKIIAKKVLSNPNAKWDGNVVILEDASAGYQGNIKVVWFK
jgi:hypothetical protein